MQVATDHILCMYVDNTDAQVSKVHSYYGSFACC